jgi:hypothetical protein
MGFLKWAKRIGLGIAGVYTGGATWGMLAADIGADIVGGVMQHRAAGQAQDRLEEGGRAGQDILRGSSRLHSPYYKAGVSQLGTLGELAGVTGQDIHDRAILDPSYEFRFKEGQRALDRGAAAKGTMMTGGHVKNTIRYGQEYASTEYGKAYDRAAGAVESQYNRAARLASSGQQAAGAMTGINRDVAGLETDIATAGADESIAKGDAWARTAGKVGDTIGGMVAQRGSSYSGTKTSTRQDTVPLTRGISGNVGTRLTPERRPYSEPLSV